MKRQHVSTCLLLLVISWLTTSPTHADTTVIVKQPTDRRNVLAVIEQIAPQRAFIHSFYRLPSDYYFLDHHPYQSLSLQMERQGRSDNRRVADGRSLLHGTLSAKAMEQLSPSWKTWGEVSYRQEKVQEIRWNETADIERLAPYLLVDATGGDLHRERYAFNGGFGYQQGDYTFGLEVTYRSLAESRTTDPRPNNIVSELNTLFSVSRALTNSYQMTLAGTIGKYKQNNSVKNFGDQDRTLLYHHSGLGYVYSQFTDNHTEPFFKGYNYGVSLAFLPQEKRGFLTNIHWRRRATEKHLNTHTHLFDLSEDLYLMEIGYATSNRHDPQKSRGVKLQLSSQQKQGTEHLYGAPGSGVYKHVGIKKPYHNSDLEASLSGYYTTTWGKGYVGLLMRSGYAATKEQYNNPLRRRTINRMHAQLTPSYQVMLGKLLLNSYLSLDFIQTVQSSLEMSNRDQTKETNDWITHDFEVESRNRLQGNIGHGCFYSYKQLLYFLTFDYRLIAPLGSPNSLLNQLNLSVGLYF